MQLVSGTAPAPGSDNAHAAFTLLWTRLPLTLLVMHSANPEALAAPLHFNFATDVIDRWAQERPESPALWCVNATTDAEQKYTFKQLATLSCQAADFLRSSGIRRGDRVLVMLPRVPEWWIGMLSLIRLGAVPVPGTLLLTARDVAYRLGSARISAVITNLDGVAKVGGFEGTRLLVGGERPGGLISTAACAGPAPSFAASGPAATIRG